MGSERSGAETFRAAGAADGRGAWKIHHSHRPAQGGKHKRSVRLVGVGSLLGRCILDALQGRRENLTVVGTDLNAQAPALAECDVALAVPVDDAPDFAAQIAEVCHAHNVDLVIPCRDPAYAVLALAVDEPGARLPPTAPADALVAKQILKVCITSCPAAGGFRLRDNPAYLLYMLDDGPPQQLESVECLRPDPRFRRHRSTVKAPLRRV